MQISLFLISLLFVAQPAAFQIEGVPFVAQAREQCGPAALSSVLAYHGLDLAPETVAERTHNEKLRGSLITDLENFARGLDFQTKSGRGTVEELRTFIREGKPVIVLVDLGRWFVTQPHYLVLLGYSPEGLIAHDGERASRLFRYPDFERMWEKLGQTYLLVYP
ncbi:MAG: cysteine peptidase family C39 domain-containing protein [Desulfatiglandales bacterium]